MRARFRCSSEFAVSMTVVPNISRLFTEGNIGIVGVNSRVNKQHIATISVSFNVHNTDELNGIIGKLRAIQGVMDIERTTG